MNKKVIGKWLGLLLPFIVLLAIWIYVQTKKSEGHARGKVLYDKHCASCHGANGEGLKLLIPPVHSADYISNNPAYLACIIRYGVKGDITVNGKEYTGNMLGLNKLEDDEIRDIVNFINVEWNGADEDYSLKEIRKQLDQCF